MGESRDQKSFWTTLPGIITAITGLVVAIGGILGVLVTAGVIGGQPPTSMPPSTPTLAPVATATAAPGLTPHTISPTSTSSTVPPPTATPAPLPTSTSSALSQQPQQWEMTASADLRALGQIVIRVPVYTFYTISIYQAGTELKNTNGRGSYQFNLVPGEYDVMIHGVRIDNLIIQRGMETRILGGTLDLSSMGRQRFELYDETKTVKLRNKNS